MEGSKLVQDILELMAKWVRYGNFLEGEKEYCPFDLLNCVMVLPSEMEKQLRIEVTISNDNGVFRFPPCNSDYDNFCKTLNDYGILIDGNKKIYWSVNLSPINRKKQLKFLKTLVTEVSRRYRNVNIYNYIN